MKSCFKNVSGSSDNEVFLNKSQIRTPIKMQTTVSLLRKMGNGFEKNEILLNSPGRFLKIKTKQEKMLSLPLKNVVHHMT